MTDRNGAGAPSAQAAPSVLMIYPKFAGGSFWSFEATSRMYGARWMMPPLGLATVAAMLPPDWPVRLLDRNIEEVTDADILAADVVMTGGMLPQRYDTQHIVAWAQRLGRKVAVGGPDVMSSPHIYADADYVVTGEAESVIGALVQAIREGSAGGRFDAPRFQADVTASPTPRFDLIKSQHYVQMTVQFSRGCPFTCEFCDIIELFGRNPRTKTTPQMLAELDAIYARSYRGHVHFVDDNLIGNKKAVKLFLPHLLEWQKAHGFPFDFSTEASLNIADDSELMALLSRCGFIGVFVGIESPDEAVLVATSKKQNARRNIADSVHRIYAHGLTIMAGFIIGFDEEKGRVGEGIADLVDEAAVPIAMIGLLYALPETQLTRRLDKEGRMHAAIATDPYPQRQRRPVHAGPQLRDAAPPPRNPAGLPHRRRQHLRSGSLSWPRAPHGGAAALRPRGDRRAAIGRVEERALCVAALLGVGDRGQGWQAAVLGHPVARAAPRLPCPGSDVPRPGGLRPHRTLLAGGGRRDRPHDRRFARADEREPARRRVSGLL